MTLTEEGKMLVKTVLKLQEMREDFSVAKMCGKHPCEECLFFIKIEGCYDKRCIISIIENFLEDVQS